MNFVNIPGPFHWIRMDDRPNAEVWRGSSGNNNPFISPTGDSCPIHNLPIEILSYLFELVADSLRSRTATDKETTGEGDYYPVYKPTFITESALRPWLTVSNVCRRWHNIACSTPSLWAVIIVPPMSRSPFFRIMWQLVRSKPLPIDIRIDLRDSSNLSDHFFHTVACGLLSYVDRWHSIDVQANEAEDMHGILEEISKPRTQTAPQLTSVVLLCCRHRSYHTQDYYLPEWKHLALFGCSAPHLKTISLTGLNLDWNQPWISSTSSLTTLQIMISHDQDGPSWAEFSTILRGAPHLQVLIFENDNNVESELVDPAWIDSNVGSTFGDNSMIPIKLLELKQLDILLPTAMQVQLLRRCYTPALTKLTIQPPDSKEPQEHYEALITQLVGPFAVIDTSEEVRLFHTKEQSRSLLVGIQHLSINHFLDMRTQCVDSLYSKLNQLTSLSLNFNQGTTFTDLLFTPTGRLCHVRLPQLKTLSIQSAGLSYLQVRHICALAWHRKDIGVPLKVLILRGVRDEFPDECLLWCQENLETFHFDPLDSN